MVTRLHGDNKASKKRLRRGYDAIAKLSLDVSEAIASRFRSDFIALTKRSKRTSSD
jgi:hypothetical protein